MLSKIEYSYMFNMCKQTCHFSSNYIQLLYLGQHILTYTWSTIILRFPGKVILRKLDIFFSSSVRVVWFKLGDMRDYHMITFVSWQKLFIMFSLMGSQIPLWLSPDHMGWQIVSNLHPDESYGANTGALLPFFGY